jgi:DNA-binding MarR family transcriptional regulator
MTEARWLDDEEQRVWRSLITMQDELTEFLDRELRHRCGVSTPDYEVLAHLSESPEGRLRPFELGRLLRWEKSRLSQHLGRMQKRGLLSRDRCVTDQRGAVVTITPRGRDLITAAAPQHVANVRDVFIDQLTKAEMKSLIAIGDKVRKRLAALETQARTE